MNTVEMHAADRGYRKRMGLWLVFALVLGTCLLWWLADGLRGVAEALGDADDARKREGVRVLLSALGLAVAVCSMAVHVAIRRRVRDILAFDALPPPHWRTVRDVRVLRGAAARAWARRLGWCRDAAALSSITAIALAAWAWWHYA